MKVRDSSHNDVNPAVLMDNASGVINILYRMLFLPYITLRMLITKKEKQKEVWLKTIQDQEILIGGISVITIIILTILAIISIVVILILGVVGLVADTTMSVGEKIFMAIVAPMGLVIMLAIAVLFINITGMLVMIVGPLWLIVGFPKVVIPIILFYTLCICINRGYYKKYST